MAGAGEQLVVAAGDQVVAFGAGVQAVHAQQPSFVQPGQFGDVQVYGPVARGEGVHHGVDGPHPSCQRAGEWCREAEQGARVGEAGGEQHGAVGGEFTHRGVQLQGAAPDVEARPQGVVSADDHGRQLRPQGQCLR